MRIILQRTIEASPEKIWFCLTDLEMRTIWQQNFVSEEILTPEQSGVGRRAVVTLRQNNQILTYDTEMLEWQPREVLMVKVVGPRGPQPFPMTMRYELSPGATISETVLTLEFDFPLKGILRLLYPLIRTAVRRTLVSNFDRLTDLAQSLSK